MRKLMWFTLGFTAACGLYAYGMGNLWIPLEGLLTSVLLVLLALLFHSRRCLLPALGILAGCTVGIYWFLGFDILYLRPVSALDDTVVQLRVTALDHSYETAYGSAVDGVTKVDGKPYRIRTFLPRDATLNPGDSLDAAFRLKFTVPKEAGDSTYFQGKGIFLTGTARGEAERLPAKSIPKWCFPAMLRQKILTILEEQFPKDTAPFAKALLLGDGRDLDYETDTAFKVSGIRHIIAVSGLHISILYTLVCMFTFRRRFSTAAVGMPVLLLFAAVAGFTPSVTRACIMVWLMMLATVFNREYDPPTALAFSVLVMLAANPMAVTSVSLQLSVGCVAGILLFREPISSWLDKKIPDRIPKKWRIFLNQSIAVSVSAMSLTTPLTAYYFGAVSLVSIVTNLLTLWVVNLIFNGLIGVCLLSLVFGKLAGILAHILSWPIRYVLAVSKLLASIPLAAVYTKSHFIMVWLALLYFLLGILLFQRKKKPGTLCCCAMLGLCFALLASWMTPLTAHTRITMLDVGQGQSILLQSQGKTFLVDCGGNSDTKTADTVAETLLSQGIYRLDGIVLTHYDRDHAGALQNLLTRVDSSYLFLPDIPNEMPQLKTTGQVVYVWEDLKLTFGTGAMSIFGPIYNGQNNENSLCVLFDTEKCDILITGDRSAFGERMLLRSRELPEVDILVAGHHGAADSTSLELLQAVAPEVILISAGKNNRFGHPAPELLQRLETLGCAVYRTDQQGTIVIRR